jgi:flagellar hook assembly protein FlgD
MLANGSYAAGLHELNWDGRDDDGRSVGPGIYYVRAIVPGVEHPVSRSLVFLK